MSIPFFLLLLNQLKIQITEKLKDNCKYKLHIINSFIFEPTEIQVSTKENCESYSNWIKNCGKIVNIIAHKEKCIFVLGPTAHSKIFSESCYIKPNLDCNYHFQIDLAPSGTPFGAKSIGKVYLQSKFNLI